MAAYVSITNYGTRTVTVCTVCDARMAHGSDDQAAALEAAEHNARHRDAA